MSEAVVEGLLEHATQTVDKDGNVTITLGGDMKLGPKSDDTVKEPLPQGAGYEFQLGDDNFALVFKTPANRLQRFLQLLVGMQWRQRV